MGVSAQGRWGVCPGRCLLRGGGVSAWGGGGVCLGGDVYHPWTRFLTHACENITFPQLLLRTVMTIEKLQH